MTTPARSWLPFGLTAEQLTIWAIMFALIYALRDFFSIVFMTYIMSYVANRVVGRLTRQPTSPTGTSRMRKPVVAIG